MADKLTRGVVVLGLGRFGRSLALELMAAGDDVLGVDADPRLVQQLSGRLTHIVEGDTTSEEVLRQLNIGDFSRAVVGMGTDLEASILTASVVLDLGVKQVWAKAISASHARILTQIGVHHVVRPEHDMGKKVAHLVRGRMLDYIEFDDGYAFVRTRVPQAMHGRSLSGFGVRQLYDVTVVGVKPAGGEFTYATPETVLRAGDEIIVSGQQRKVEAFAALS
ncbi:potassium channel family protein [Nocardioides insulae]|uniref:potassium channel family protein n=1 Tax=Nocardioides insulae TaxID=394734 RepID=UPI00048D88D7|nr:TrkA family potassium uptake protein [Nocardioides insulae]